MIELSKSEFTVECEECGASVKITMEDVSKEKIVKCRNGHKMQLIDSGKNAKKAIKSADKMFSDLDKMFKG